MRLGRERDRLGDLAGGEVNRRNGLSEDPRDEQRLAVGADRKPARKALAGDGGQREGARASDRAVGVVELLHVVLAGAGGVQLGAVGMPGEPEPRVVERHGALHRPRCDVDDGERRPRQPVAGDDQIFRVGGLDDVQRQVADAHMLAGRLNAPAVGQQRGAVGHGARQGRGGSRRLGACAQRAPRHGSQHNSSKNPRCGAPGRRDHRRATDSANQGVCRGERRRNDGWSRRGGAT